MSDSWQNSEELIQISKKIKELRIKAGYTSYENFALEHGLGRKYYWLVEKGKAKISFVYFVKLMKCLKIAPSEFLREINL